MKFPIGRVALAALAVLAPHPALALLTTPPPPPPHARYGPVVQCFAGYAVAVAPSEAIYVMEDGISLVTADYLMNLSVEHLDPYHVNRRIGEFDDPRLGRIVRYETGDDDDSRRIELRLPPVEGAQAVILRSRPAEEAIALSRVNRSTEGTACGNFSAPDFRGEHPDALRWAPELISGPLHRCERLIGYSLSAGEALRHPWPRRADQKPSRVVLPGAHLAVHGPYRVPPGARDPVSAGYQIIVREGYDEPYLQLSPARSFLRRQPRGERYDYDFRIEFAPGGEAAARAFATRLEFVNSGDPRCTANRERR